MSKLKKIETLKNRANEINEEIKLIKNELSRLETERDSLNIELNTEETLMSIEEVNDENSMCVYLTPDSKTTPIMDKFYFSNYTYLVFKNYCSCRNGRFSLVIRKNFKKVSSKSNSLVMTDLKKHAQMYISPNILNVYNSTSRMFPLLEEIVKLINNENDGDKAYFENLCSLGGQTFKNQRNIGTEYNGEYMVSQHLYGEVTNFQIIGIIYEK